MTFLHIANANFESELSSTKPTTVAALIQSHPIFLQLQFLPLLYAGPDDGVAVTHAPSSFFHRVHLLEEKNFPYENVESWGASPSIAAWAEKRKLAYTMPKWDIVKHVNSKAFSFNESPKLPGAELIHTLAELEQWEQKTEGPKVLKTCFGVSGKGHLFLPSPHMKKFAEQEFAMSRPLIAEPWVERKLDFSTQWMIHPDQTIECLGATVCVNDQRGKYNSNRVGDLHSLFGKYFPFLEIHKEIVFPILQKMASLGYFGNVGFDAMIWGNDELHPVVEINARKTMGWVALEISKRRFPKQTIALSYLTKSNLTRGNCKACAPQKIDDFDASFQGQQAGPCRADETMPEWAGEEARRKMAPKGRFSGAHKFCNCLDNLLPDAIVQKDGSLLHFPKKLVVEVLANKS